MFLLLFRGILRRSSKAINSAFGGSTYANILQIRNLIHPPCFKRFKLKIKHTSLNKRFVTGTFFLVKNIGLKKEIVSEGSN